MDARPDLADGEGAGRREGLIRKKGLNLLEFWSIIKAQRKTSRKPLDGWPIDGFQKI